MPSRSQAWQEVEVDSLVSPAKVSACASCHWGVIDGQPCVRCGTATPDTYSIPLIRAPSDLSALIAECETACGDEQEPPSPTSSRAVDSLLASVEQAADRHDRQADCRLDLGTKRTPPPLPPTRGTGSKGQRTKSCSLGQSTPVRSSRPNTTISRKRRTTPDLEAAIAKATEEAAMAWETEGTVAEDEPPAGWIDAQVEAWEAEGVAADEPPAGWIDAQVKEPATKSDTAQCFQQHLTSGDEQQQHIYSGWVAQLPDNQFHLLQQAVLQRESIGSSMLVRCQSEGSPGGFIQRSEDPLAIVRPTSDRCQSEETPEDMAQTILAQERLQRSSGNRVIDGCETRDRSQTLPLPLPAIRSVKPIRSTCRRPPNKTPPPPPPTVMICEQPTWDSLYDLTLQRNPEPAAAVQHYDDTRLGSKVTVQLLNVRFA